MGCCCKKKEEDHVISNSPQRQRKCQDVLWLILFVAATYYSYYTAFEAKNPENQLYKPIYTKGVDSWGNICSLDTEANRHTYTAVVEGENYGYPISTIESNLFYPTFYAQDHSANPVMYASAISLNSPAVCLPACPGSKLEAVIPTMFEDDALMNNLAALVSSQPSTILQFNILVGVSFPEEQYPGALDALTNGLWCETVMASAGYDATIGQEGASNVSAAAICSGTIESTVLTPSSTLGSRCTPHYKLALKIGSMIAEGSEAQVSNATGGISVANTIEMLNDGAQAVIVYKKQILWSFLGSVVVALIVIVLIQVLTKYIILTILVLFSLSAVAAMGWTFFRYKQVEDPTWGVDCTAEERTLPFQYSALRTNMNYLSGMPLDPSSAWALDPSTAANEELRESYSMGRAEIETRLASLCDTNANLTGLTDAEIKKAQDTAMYMMAGVWTFSIICLITICCCCSNIWLAVTLFDEAGQCVFAIPGILMQPLWTLAITAVTFIVLLWQFIYTMQVKVPMQDPDNSGWVIWDSPSIYWKYWFVYTFFVTVWVLVFVDGCHQVSMAGAVSGWFWKHGEEMAEDKGCLHRCKPCPARTALCDLIKFNLGSVALGAMLIAIVRTIQLIVWLVEQAAKKQAGGKEPSKLVKAIFCCIKCMVACIEKFLSFINRNAFIGIAVFGYSFCRSAQKCIALKVENAGRAVVLMAICGAVLFLGKVISIVGSIFIFRRALTHQLGSIENMDFNTQVGVYTAVGIFSWWITSIFLSVYGLALDTIFICFCEDQQRNNGRDRPYKSSMKLQKFMRENA